MRQAPLQLASVQRTSRDRPLFYEHRYSTFMSLAPADVVSCKLVLMILPMMSLIPPAVTRSGRRGTRRETRDFTVP
jgi:hypothetical protein